MGWSLLHHRAVLCLAGAAPAGQQVCSSSDLVWERPLLTSPACQDKDWPFVPTHTCMPKGHLPSGLREKLHCYGKIS